MLQCVGSLQAAGSAELEDPGIVEPVAVARAACCRPRVITCTWLRLTDDIDDVNIEHVVLHRVLDDNEVLAAVEVLVYFLRDFVLERSVRVHGLRLRWIAIVLTEDPDLQPSGVDLLRYR